MLIDTTRSSTGEQGLGLQWDALRKNGCDELLEDGCSEVLSDRPWRERSLIHARESDTLIVCKFDRIGRAPPLIAQIGESSAPHCMILNRGASSRLVERPVPQVQPTVRTELPEYHSNRSGYR